MIKHIEIATRNYCKNNNYFRDQYGINLPNTHLQDYNLNKVLLFLTLI